MERLAVLERMRRAPVLRRLPLGELDALASRCRLRDLAAKEALIEEGAPAGPAFLVLEGQLVVRKRIGQGDSAVLGVRGPGEWVGEMALVAPGRRSASVVAQGRARVLEVPRRAFLAMLARHGDAALDLLRVVTRRLRESDAARIEALEAKNRALASHNERLRRENVRLREELDEASDFDAYLGASPAAQRVRAAARRAAANDLPVLLLGETGTGKELLARAIHTSGPRSRREFVAVNCALFTETLLESELFGHARGAFTGALATKRGLVEEADGGTLLLDEIADMPLALQGALLRFLDRGEFRRLGETRVRRARVRVIAATHVDLDRATREGRFRRDLLYRLDVIRIELPPLRARREDIPRLVARISERMASRLEVAPLRFEPAALELLAAYPFPGNVRELENEIARLYAALDPGSTVRPDDLSPKIRVPDPEAELSYGEAVRAFKARLVRVALEESGGNRALAAQRLGVHRSNLVRMIRELGLEVPARGRPRPGLPPP